MMETAGFLAFCFCFRATTFGYDVGRYISLERLIEENKERYHETLEQSSAGWHEGSMIPGHKSITFFSV
jgi:hypothetical protein